MMVTPKSRSPMLTLGLRLNGSFHVSFMDLPGKKRKLETGSLYTGTVKVLIIEVEYSRLPCCLDRSGSQNEIKLQWLRAFRHLDQQSCFQGNVRVVRNDELQ